MIKYYKNSSSDIILCLKLMYLFIGIDIIGSLLNLNFAFFRYLLATLVVYYFFKSVFSQQNRYHLVFYLRKAKFLFFFIWTFIIIAASLPQVFTGPNNIIDFKRLISGQLLLYFIPFFIFYKPSLLFIKLLFKFSYSLSIIYLLITIPFLNYFTNGKLSGEGYAIIFAAAASIILLTLSYHSPKVQYITLFTFLLAIFINAVNVRRNQIAYFGSILFFTVVIHLFASSKFLIYRKKKFLTSIFIILIPISFYIFINLQRFEPIIEKSKTGMESRDAPIKDFFADFNEHPNDWIVGRGINGLVRSSTNAPYDIGSRAGIENGYLMHILVGGWIYLGLIILIALPAMYLGFFKSKNILCKSFAAIILTYFIDMIGFGIAQTTLKFGLIWIGISICYSARMRNYSDEFLKSVIGLK